MSTAPFQVRVRSIAYEAQGILAFELVAPDGGQLPAFSAGAHVDVHLPNGLIRSYSLSNDQSERHRYLIGVNRDPASRGGSRYLHERVRPGDILTVSGPRNHFVLDETAERSLFIAGGIGITPILSMIRRQRERGASWTLHYCARSREHAAFLDDIHRLADGGSGRVMLSFDSERAGRRLDIPAVVASASADTHLYCCGPLPMLDAFDRATAQRFARTVHREYFAARGAPVLEGGFSVELARSGTTLTVPPGKSILDVVLDAGVPVPHSCMEGICGSCETRVLAGAPDHRDLILSEQEKASNTTMLICCSGSKGGPLVLDL